MDKKLYSHDGSRIWKSTEDWRSTGWFENPVSVPKLIFQDSSFYRIPVVEIAGMRLHPVHVSGYHDASYFSGWLGVGYSPAPFSMKAFQDDDGKVYRFGCTFYIDTITGHHELSDHDKQAVNVYLVEVYDIPTDCIKPVNLR